MPLRGVVLEGVPVKWEDVPVFVLPPEVGIALTHDPNRVGLHLSDLTICPHKVHMSRTHDCYVTPEAAYKMARGLAWDALAQFNRRINAYYQQPFYRKLGDELVVGTPDIIDVALHAIEDYKCPARTYQSPPEYYALQLNGYAWVSAPYLRDLGIPPIEWLFLDVFGPSGYKQMAVELWDEWDIELELQIRLNELNRVMASEPSLCSDPRCVFCRSTGLYLPLEDDVVEPV